MRGDSEKDEGRGGGEREIEREEGGGGLRGDSEKDEGRAIESE